MLPAFFMDVLIKMQQQTVLSLGSPNYKGSLNTEFNAATRHNSIHMLKKSNTSIMLNSDHQFAANM